MLPLHNNLFTEYENFLKYYGLYQNGYLTNAAIILFAKNPAKYCPQSRVRLTVFKDNKTGKEYYYDKIFEGNIFKIVEEITQFFEVNIGISSQFNQNNWKRKDTTFPKIALREGLLNALIHRDYSNVSGSVNIEFYPDRLEIINYGNLPHELKLSDLKKNHLSLPRNPDIAHISFIRNWIEKIGRGTLKIIEDCKEKELPTPKWETGNGFTKIIFPQITLVGKYSYADIQHTKKNNKENI